jgi:hypothetical protein
MRGTLLHKRRKERKKKKKEEEEKQRGLSCACSDAHFSWCLSL